MKSYKELRPFSQQILLKLLDAYPDWEKYIDIEEEGTFELAVPAPQGSQAGWLAIIADKDDELWIRYRYPHMFYGIDDENELLKVIAELMEDKALFVVITKDDKWVETTLTKPGEYPELEEGEMVRIVSWTGKYDREYNYDKENF